MERIKVAFAGVELGEPVVNWVPAFKIGEGVAVICDNGHAIIEHVEPSKLWAGFYEFAEGYKEAIGEFRYSSDEELAKVLAV